MLVRLPFWERALDEFLTSHEHAPFAYGTSDCCLIAADAIETMTGTDIAAAFRGRYSTALGSVRITRQLTGGHTCADAVAYAARQHGLIEWRLPLLAKRGDLVLIRIGDQLIGGFVHLNGRHVVSIGELGLIRLPLTSVHKAWKV